MATFIVSQQEYERANEMLALAAEVIRKNLPTVTVHYDEADCDGLCFAEDCELAQLDGQPIPAGNIGHWAILNPGAADQYRAEAKASRSALGFDHASKHIAPRDLRLAIEALRGDRPNPEGPVQALLETGHALSAQLPSAAGLDTYHAKHELRDFRDALAVFPVPGAAK